MRLTLTAASALLVLTLFIPTARAMFAPPQGVPVERLVKNITAYAAEHPEDANAQYLLGRVHALAYRHNRGVVGTYGEDKQTGLPRVADDHVQGWVRMPPEPKEAPEPAPDAQPRGEAERVPAPAAIAAAPDPGELRKPDPLTPEQRAAHLAKAIEHYVKAIEMDPKPAHYHLGLAYVLDTGREFVGQVPPPEVRTTDGEPTYEQAKRAYHTLTTVGEDKPIHSMLLRRYWREAAIEKYLDAYNRANEKDAQIRHRPLAGLQTLVSYEAGQSYIRLINEREATEGEKQSVAAVQTHLKALEKTPHGPVTPIVFAVDAPRPLELLLAPDRVVRFDLDGDGHAEPRPWVAPGTAILCWDPDRTGAITSGKQLFGSVTFHLYPGDGYTAMNLLDDDRDGELSGPELAGLALWFDRDADGVSDPGEVIPIERTPVAGLSTAALSHDPIGAAPMNPFGLRLRDGRRLPTYDWIAPAAPAESVDSPRR